VVALKKKEKRLLPLFRLFEDIKVDFWNGQQVGATMQEKNVLL
jgi:hypothetical protein